jgi:hypothetical protein
MACYDRAAADREAHVDVVGEAWYRRGVRLRRDRRFAEAAAQWKGILELRARPARRRLAAGDIDVLTTLQQYATEALAVHHEHREKDYEGARELALRLLDDETFEKRDRARHRLARLERKIASNDDSQLFA